jgi:hypothetical protein
VNAEQVEKAVRLWLEEVVIGLNLCPFASKPYLDNQVRFAVSECTQEDCLLTHLESELQLLAETPASDIETTLLIVPNMLTDFESFNNFLDWVDQLLVDLNYEGVFQVATFHPHYQFADTQPEDAENLTNRSPYPILHILREESLEKAIEHYPDVESIPEHNIETMQQLTQAQKRVLFPYLYK